MATSGTPSADARSSNGRLHRRAYRAGYTRGATGDTARPAWMEHADMASEVEAAYRQGQADAAGGAARAAPAPAAPREPAPTGPSSDGRNVPTSRQQSRAPARRGPAVARPLDSAASSAARQFPLPIASDAGGFLLGLLGYALLWNFMAGGMDQVRGWLAAKFLNKPFGQAPEGSPGKPKPGVVPAPGNIAGSTGIGAVVPQPYPGGPALAIPGLGAERPV